MIIGKIYRKYFKNNLFMKMILFFSIVMIMTIITFSYLMFLSMSEAAVQRQMNIQKRAVESVSNYISGKYESVQNMMRDVYRDSELANNTSFFMEHPYEEYVRFRLDKFYSDIGATTDAVQFFRNKMEDDPDIRSLILYSADQQHLYAYNQHKQFKIIETNAARSFVPDAMYLEEEAQVSIPNIWVRKVIDLPDEPMFSLRVPVNNKQSLRNIGQLLVYFDGRQIWDSLANYRDDLKGTIVVLSADGDVLFDTSNMFYGREYPYAEQIHSIYDTGVIDEGMTVTKLTQSQGGFTVLSAVPEEEIAATYEGVRKSIIMIALMCILVAIVAPSLFIGNFAKRIYNIIRFTRKVKKGDLKARIADSREDELGQISKSFDDMLDELNLYIDRVLKAEIKQKRTELAALEARVNPHFLYNTLEVIRMRAISQGAGDVAEMIYSLSVLFKSYVQQKSNYTLKDELEACRLYLELFRIRYKDKFAYTIHCDKSFEGISIFKMSLQPIIENYILHGMRPDRSDNHIGISVQSYGEDCVVEVRDNGKGIHPERLEQIVMGLDHPDENAESFGLRSIHERLKLLYGERYGLGIESEEERGTTLTVRFPQMGEGG
ncbi:cache domain-containing sensor histidine kinase [Paenibacillus lentus]|uniref:Sensor histidine kinase n=1 Tax=Paenibacillus lentus TaxID=1338368 RepID=A0A3S8RQH1_9BACL|nr:sensor histidine kinase [Paenibacillus lentus]AZK45224.1 sensor histidine kinase [Paenibacillus lentus]